MTVPVMRNLRAILHQWLSDGYTAHETPLDGYGQEVVREVLALLGPVPVTREDRETPAGCKHLFINISDSGPAECAWCGQSESAPLPTPPAARETMGLVQEMERHIYVDGECLSVEWDDARELAIRHEAAWQAERQALVAQVEQAERERDEARAEVVHVTEMHVVPGKAAAQFAGIGVEAFALLIAEFFVAAKGTNYVEWQADVTGTFTTPEFVLTCQKRTGKTPDQLRREAEQERDALAQQVEALRQERDSARGERDESERNAVEALRAQERAEDALTTAQQDAARLREALEQIVLEITDEHANDRNALGSCIEVVRIARAALAAPADPTTKETTHD